MPVACGLVAAAVFMLLQWLHIGLTPFVFADEWVYSAGARLGPLGKAEVPSYLYLWVMRATSSCGPGFLECARLLNTAFFCASLPFIYLVARRFCSTWVALIVATLSVLVGASWYTAAFMPESMYFFAFWCFTAAMLVGKRKLAGRHGLLVGAVLGAMTLVKVHAIFLIPAALVYFAACEWYANGRISWRRIGKYAGCLLLAFLVVRFGVGRMLAGKAAMSLFGPLYASQSMLDMAALKQTLHDTAFLVFGHAMVICILYAVPVYVVLTVPLGPTQRDEITSAQRELAIFTFLVLGSLVVVTAWFTARVHVVQFGQDLGRLHLRYYSFALPLLLVVVAARLRGDVRRASWPQMIAAVLVASLALYGCLGQLQGFTPSPIDSPEIFGLTQTPGLLRALVFASVASLAVLMIGVRASSKVYLFAIAPLLIVTATWKVNQQVAQAHVPAAADRAGIVTKLLLGPQTSRLAIVGSNIFDIYHARFAVDDADTEIFVSSEGHPLDPTAVMDKDWFLLLNGQPSPVEAGVTLPLADGATLVRVGNLQTADFRSSGNVDVQALDGFGTVEPFGRWTIQADAAVTMRHPLPRHFMLRLTARGFASNANAPITIRIGNEEKTAAFGSRMQDQSLEFHSDGSQTQIHLAIPHAQSPVALGQTNDPRRLGIALQQLRIAPFPNPN